MRNVSKISVGKPDEKRPFGRQVEMDRPIKMDLKELGCVGVDRIQLA
jgi:hypothetical protein